MKMERFLIDTNIFILLFNDRLAESLPDGEIVCSIITEIELLSLPTLTSAEDVIIRERLAELTIYDIDYEVKEETIRLRRSHRLKLPDAVIAATAIINDAVLVTNDKKLQIVPELRCRELFLKS